jgi:hypothetical protein
MFTEHREGRRRYFSPDVITIRSVQLYMLHPEKCMQYIVLQKYFIHVHVVCIYISTTYIVSVGYCFTTYYLRDQMSKGQAVAQYNVPMNEDSRAN